MASQQNWYSIVLLVATIAAGCASTTTSSRIERITIGSGGGFSGMQSGYRLERSGIVEEWDMQSGSMHIRATAKFPASIVRRFFVHAEELKLDTLTIDQPGNMTWWLETTSGNSSKRLRWSDRTRIPPELAAFDSELRTFCTNAISGK